MRVLCEAESAGTKNKTGEVLPCFVLHSPVTETVTDSHPPDQHRDRDDLAVFLYVYLFRGRPLDTTAAYLQIPYLLWATFAGYLNFMIYLLN